MNTTFHLWLLALLLPAHAIHAQGLINGGFEQYDRANRFLPGWHISIKSLLNDSIQRDYGATFNGIEGSVVDYATHLPSQPYVTMRPGTDIHPKELGRGEYYLWGVGFGDEGSIFVEQTLVVPEDTRGLQFRSYLPQTVYLNGELAALLQKEIVAPGVVEWWADLSRFAGQEISVAISIYEGGGIDDVHFTSEPVPEPRILSLLGLATIALVTFRGWATRERRC